METRSRSTRPPVCCALPPAMSRCARSRRSRARSSTPVVSSPTFARTETSRPSAERRAAALVAWSAALLGSALPYIFFKELLHRDAPWWLLPGILVLLLAIAALPAAHPVRSYVLLMASLVVGKEIKDLVEATGPFDAWSTTASDHERLFV